jgi:hypothetical protein
MKLSFAPDTLSLMGRVCDAVYAELSATPPGATKAVRRNIAARVMEAVGLGVRDPERLKAIALKKGSP